MMKRYIRLLLAGMSLGVSVSYIPVPVFAQTEALPSMMKAAPFPFQVSSLGMGPVKIGMKPSEAAKALGVKFKTEYHPETDQTGCYYVFSEAKGYQSVFFMIGDAKIQGAEGPPQKVKVLEEGFIRRIDVQGPGIFTKEGAQVGDTEERIKKLYLDRVKVELHPYGESEEEVRQNKTLFPSHYLVVLPEKDIIFETDGKVVTSYRAGRPEEVALIEGCS